MKKLKIIIAVLISLVSIAFVIFWDMYLKDYIDSEQVVVVNTEKDILRGQRLTQDMFAIEARPKSSLVDGVLLETDLNTIIGKNAADRLIKNSQVSVHQIDFDDITPNKEEGEAIRPLPNEWIYAKPGSLRGKDQVSIYAVNRTDEVHTREGLNLILEEVPVVYAKDSSNREVQTEKIDGERRLDASGQITDLEVLLNEEDFSTLMASINQGYQLYITYN